MAAYQSIFQRYERKYLLDSAAYEALRAQIDPYLSYNEYWKSNIMNLYYDTPTYYLIRESLEKPLYKEKLRLRSYGMATHEGTAFVEIKKKYEGIVYKRRVGMPYDRAVAYLDGTDVPPKPSQITNEIDYFCKHYANLRPVMMIAYDREALFCKENPELRITFDTNIQWRTDRLDLTVPPDGNMLLKPESYLMEVKIPGTMPLWLSRILGEEKIYPTTYSKYGSAYQEYMKNQVFQSSRRNGEAIYV